MALNLRIVKRLASGILKCGKKRVVLNPDCGTQFKDVTTRAGVRKLIKKHLIVRKSIKSQSRARCRLYRDAKSKGRHMGLGKRRGTKNARWNQKRSWIVRQRVFRRLLRKLREKKKIDNTSYHAFYMRTKGNQFKNKRVLIEAIWNAKNTLLKQQAIKQQCEAKINKARLKKERAEARKNELIHAI